LSLANTPITGIESWHIGLKGQGSVLILVGNEVKYTLQELEKVDGHAIYVEWYRDVETAKSFFMILRTLSYWG